MDALLDAASRIVSRGDALTMATVAAEAGISRATAYRRSGGKFQLLAALEARGVEVPSESPVRGRILETVRTHLAHHGLLATSIEDLADEVGVHPATIYRLFGDRETLLGEALSSLVPTVFLDVFRDPHLPPQEVLVRVAAGLILFISTFPGLVAQLLVPASGARQELMRLRGMQSDLGKLLADYFERCAQLGTLPPGDADARTGAFAGLCLGTTLMVPVGPLTTTDANERARWVVARFFSGEAAQVTTERA